MYSILLEKFSNSNISKKLSDSNISKISPTSFNIRWTPIRIKIFASIVSKTFRWMFKYAIFSPSLGCCFQITIPFLLTKRNDKIKNTFFAYINQNKTIEMERILTNFLMLFPRGIRAFLFDTRPVAKAVLYWLCKLRISARSESEIRDALQPASTIWTKNLCLLKILY